MVKHTAEPSRTVLVVVHDPSVTRMLRLALGGEGFRVSQATTGPEALRRLDRAAVDAVVLDLGLPDGLCGAVLERLCRWRGDAAPAPAWAAISAMDREEIRRRHGDLGGRFLPTPFDPWELVRMLESSRR